MKRKKIYITAFTATNFGDDLFVKVLCDRYPQHRFYIDCYDSEDTAFESIPNLTVLNRGNAKGKWMERLQKYTGKLGFFVDFAYDAQVYIGGSIFIEFQNELQYNGYFKNLYGSKIRPDIPYFILGSNFGPYHHPEFVEKHKEFFRYQVDDLCMRDRASYELFKDLENVRYAPDVLCTCSLPKISKENLIVISCIYDQKREESRSFDNEAYARKMAELCRYYKSLGKEVCLLSMCSQQKDTQMCQNIRQLLDYDVHIVEYSGNLDEVLKLFAAAEYVIASRFHAMILGWLAGVPVYPVAYSNKTTNVIEDFGFSGNFSTVDEFCTCPVDQLDANRLNNVVFSMKKLQTDAQAQFLKLDEFLQE